jgi:hypothetical protein
VPQLAELAEARSATDSSGSSSTAVVSRVEDPLAALSAANPVAAPLIQVGEVSFLSPCEASFRRQPQSASKDYTTASAALYNTAKLCPAAQPISCLSGSCRMCVCCPLTTN